MLNGLDYHPIAVAVKRALTALGGVLVGPIGTNGLLLAADSSQSSGMNFVPPSRITRGRLTLTTALPVTTADVLAAGTVYWTPHLGDTVYIYDGSGWIPFTCAEMSVVLDNNAGHAGYHQASRNFDMFAFNDAGTRRIGTGPTWNAGAVAGSDTARGTGAGSTELQLLNGIQTNKNQIDLRWGNAAGNVVTVTANKATYLGSFRTTAVDGQTEDSLAKRYLWNNYNEEPRPMKVIEATGTWTYTTNTFRQARATTTNQLDCLIGVAKSSVWADVHMNASNDTTVGNNADVGIGINSTTVDSSIVRGPASGAYVLNQQVSSFASYVGFPGIGRIQLVWLEKAGATGTTTWSGNGLKGIYGEVRA